MKKLIFLFVFISSFSSFSKDFDYSINLQEKNKKTIALVNMKLKEGLYIYIDSLNVSFKDSSISNISELQVLKEKSILDPFAKIYKSVLFDETGIAFSFEKKDPSKALESISLTYQACTEKVCFLPKNINLNINKKDESDLFKKFRSSHFLLILLFVFFSGLLTSLTPCILPLIPITISFFKNSISGSNKSLLLSSVFYILGLCSAFSLLGVISVASGQILGRFLSFSLVSGFLFIAFYLLALSMLDVFEIKMPRFLTNHKHESKASYGNKFISGAIAGVVSSPCLTPVLFSLLAYISSEQNLLKGTLLLFAFSLGFSVILFFISLSPRFVSYFKKLNPIAPFIKMALGFTILLIALYYGKPFIGDEFIWLFSFFVFTLTGILIFLLKKDVLKSALIFLASFIFLFMHFKNTENAEFVTWTQWERKSLEIKNKPKILYFSADWCMSCLSLSKEIFQNRKMEKYQNDIIWMKYDATEINEEFLKLKKMFNIYGLPTILFFDSKGSLDVSLTVKGLVDFEEFEKKIKEIKKR